MIQLRLQIQANIRQILIAQCAALGVLLRRQPFCLCFSGQFAAQQYGISQWCATDAPGDSGWRGGETVGLWDSNYNRKHTYAGFADGLAGKL